MSSWLVISGLGVDDAVAIAQQNPDTAVIALAGEVIAPIMADVVQVLIVTSMFACMLAFHNIVTRYLFTLGQRGVLPRSLAVVHATHRAPSRASLWVSGTSTLIVAVSALAQLDPVLQIYTWYSGAGAVGVIFMMTLTSAAILGFAKNYRAHATTTPRANTGVLLATALGGIGLLLVLGISLWNFPFLVDGTTAAVIWGLVLSGFFLAGFFLPTGAPQSGAARTS